PPRSGVSLDHLPDELLLRVLLCLPLQDLVRTSAVSTRWRRLAWDECLWRSVDLEGLVQVGPALRRVLRTGVRRLRCPRVFLEEPHFPHLSCLQLVQMDLSNSSIPTPALESIIGGCRLLEFLSLEGLQLSDAVLTSLSENRRLLQLNLSGCSGFSAAALLRLLAACCRVQQLNVSWCSFSSQHVKTLVQHLSPSVTHLNLSGYRENLTLEDVKVLVSRCPNLETLDLSDSTLLTADCFQVLKQLRFLVHLSLSRCYQIHLAALSDLGRTLPSLGLLDVFGVVPPGRLAALGEEVPGVRVNATPFSRAGAASSG
uniref:S-phase kinase-associated protein 2, E3 ubiquitin protein ligase n=1 Tax=Tetraodon nigroviridis TaxID=99883 RepID=H3C515_TETNG